LESDRAARLEVIERQAKEFREKLEEIEADRAARLEVINKQGRHIGALEEQIKGLKIELSTLRSSRSWRMTASFRWAHQQWQLFSKGPLMILSGKWSLRFHT
jgi:predicted nuclease with TOPRIM domain